MVHHQPLGLIRLRNLVGLRRSRAIMDTRRPRNTADPQARRLPLQRTRSELDLWSEARPTHRQRHTRMAIRILKLRDVAIRTLPIRLPSTAPSNSHMVMRDHTVEEVTGTNFSKSTWSLCNARGRINQRICSTEGWQKAIYYAEQQRASFVEPGFLELPTTVRGEFVLCRYR